MLSDPLLYCYYCMLSSLSTPADTVYAGVAVCINHLRTPGPTISTTTPTTPTTITITPHQKEDNSTWAS